MPAVGAVELPHTWRPRLGRVVPYTMATLLLVLLTTVALLLPDSAGAIDRVGIIGFAVVAFALIHRLADVRVVGRADGLVVQNWALRREVAWAEVVGVRLAPGDAWLVLDLDDGSTLAAMGVQGADGERGRRYAREVAVCVAVYGAPRGGSSEDV